MTEITRTINNVNAVSTLQGELVVNNSNLSVGGNWLQNAYSDAWGTAVGMYALADLNTASVSDGGYNNTACGFAALRTLVNGEKNTAVGARTLYYCTASNNTAVGNQAGDNVTTGEENVLIGPEAGGNLTTGNCNVCIGSHCGVYSDDCTNAIVLGSRSSPSSTPYTNTASNQLYIAPAVTSFNFPSLAASTGTGAGTIIEYDSSGNIIPSAGTYNSVAALDTVIGNLLAPYAMSWEAANEYAIDQTGNPVILPIWGALNFGNTANMASLSTWTCPAAGLWHISASFGFILSEEDIPVSFQLYHNGAEVWYFTEWFRTASTGEGATTECESIYLNLAVGDTLAWYSEAANGITLTVGGGNSNSGNTTFNAIRIAPGYTPA
jgi:hypothetical protein